MNMQRTFFGGVGMVKIDHVLQKSTFKELKVLSYQPAQTAIQQLKKKKKKSNETSHFITDDVQDILGCTLPLKTYISNSQPQPNTSLSFLIDQMGLVVLLQTRASLLGSIVVYVALLAGRRRCWDFLPFRKWYTRMARTMTIATPNTIANAKMAVKMN